MSEFYLLEDLAKEAKLAPMYIERYIALGIIEPVRREEGATGREILYFDERALKRLKRAKMLRKGGCDFKTVKYMLDTKVWGAD